MSRRGALVVIEGLDRSGKTTQTSLLVNRLESEGKHVKLVKFPDRTTPIGKMIDSYLRSQSELDDHVIHLLFSANRWELATSIETLLREGTTVICDRYAFSGIAFTHAKSLSTNSIPTGAHGRLSYEWCRAPDAGLPAPDLTLFLDITPEAARLRGGYGEERYEKGELQQRVREVFGRIEEDVRQSGGRWVIIDAGTDKDLVSNVIWDHVKVFAEGLNKDQISRLWLESSSSNKILDE